MTHYVPLLEFTHSRNRINTINEFLRTETFEFSSAMAYFIEYLFFDLEFFDAETTPPVTINFYDFLNTTSRWCAQYMHDQMHNFSD